MSFRLHHSTNLSSSLDATWPIFSSPSHLARLQQALEGCKRCEVTPPISAFTLSDCPIPLAEVKTLLESTARPTPAQLHGLDWPAFDTKDAQAVRFEFMLAPFGTKVEGVQVAYASPAEGGSIAFGLVFFHSHVVSAGIEERKLRLVEAVEGGKTRVTETVWGTAPRVLAWTLSKTGMAAKTHRSHVESYAGLVKETLYGGGHGFDDPVRK